MSIRQRTTEPLADLDLFSGASPSEIARARQVLTMLKVDAGTVLMQQGGFGMEFLIIAEGEATVSIGTQLVATLGRGDFVGEMSLLGRGRRTATVTAVTPLTFYVANSAEFTALLEAVPSVGERIVQTAAEREAHNRRSLAA